jgi:hypothetical protein
LRCGGLGRFDRSRSGAAGGAASKWQQSDIAGALDGHTEPTLVPRADSSHAARKNLAAFLHKLGKNVGTLVVDQIDFFDTELADLLFAEKLALAAARSAGTASGPTRSAFTASAATAWTTFTTASAAMTTVSSTRTARAAFATRRRSRRCCLRSCRCLILFV